MDNGPPQSRQISRRGAVRRLLEYLSGAGAYRREENKEDDEESEVQGKVPLRCCLDQLRVESERMRGLIGELSEDETTPIECDTEEGELVVYICAKKDTMETFVGDYTSDHPYKD